MVVPNIELERIVSGEVNARIHWPSAIAILQFRAETGQGFPTLDILSLES